MNKLNKSTRERERIYKILEVNDATNKASWWNIADEIAYKLSIQKKEILNEIIDLIEDDTTARGQTISYGRILIYLNKEIK